MNYKLVVEDENNMTLISSKRGTIDNNQKFTLSNKTELKRNIPFSKQQNIDFSTGFVFPSHNSKSYDSKAMRRMCIEEIEILKMIIECFDFKNLYKFS